MRTDIVPYLNRIAKLYGAKLIYRQGSGGTYWNGEIQVGIGDSTKDVICTFCHEMSHLINDVEGKHPIYHKMTAKKAIQKYGLAKYCNLALKAEIYTDKRAREFCELWFPEYKYEGSYKNSEYWKGFLVGYYLPEGG